MRAMRWTIRIVALLFVALVLASIAVVAFGIYIDLMPMRGPIEAAASDALRRPVTIEKRLQLQPTLTPTLEVQGLRIGDPGGSDAEDVLYLELARIQLDLVPLLRGEIRIHEVTAEGVAANIVLGQMRGEPQPEGQAPAAEPDAARVGEEPPPLTFEEIVDLTLKDIVVVVRNPKTDATYKFLLSELSGAAAKGEPLRLTAKGSYQGQDYSIDIGGASLNDLVQLKWAWPLAMSIDVAGVSFELTPEDDAAAAQDTTQPTVGAQYRLSLNAGRLDELSPIVGIDLPPMGPINIEGRFGVTENGFSISSLDIQIGTSDLHGEFEYDTTAERPHADIRLLSKLTQLHDFTFESWSLASGEGAEAESPVPAVEGDKPRKERALLSPEVLTALDFALRLIIDDVRSGEKRLGGGELMHSKLSNQLAAFLRGVKAASGGRIVEIFVMDNHGLNVGQTDPTGDYMQGDEAKWKKTYPVSAHAVLIDEVEEDGGINISQTSLTVARPNGARLGAVTIAINVDKLK